MTLNFILQYLTWHNIHRNLVDAKGMNIKEAKIGFRAFKLLKEGTSLPSDIHIRLASHSDGTRVYLYKGPEAAEYFTLEEWQKVQLDEATFTSFPFVEIAAACIYRIIHDNMEEVLNYSKGIKKTITAVLDNYYKSCDAIAEQFCRKHNLYAPGNEEVYWVANKPGEVLTVGDYIFDMTDIVTDLAEDLPEEALFQWYDYSLDCYSKNQSPKYNYINWYKYVYCESGNQDK